MVKNRENVGILHSSMDSTQDVLYPDYWKQMENFSIKMIPVSTVFAGCFNISKEDHAMRITTEPTLFFDPQAEPRVRFCPVCGGCTYPPGHHCLRCGEAEP